jgi:hypothetical protein
MSTALKQLQSLPLDGIGEIGSRGIHNVIAIRYEYQAYATKFILLDLWELSYLLGSGIELGFDYPINLFIAKLINCPQVPIIQ